MRNWLMVLGVACVMLAAVVPGFAGAAASEGPPEVWLVAPLQVRYTPLAEVWPISVGALALAPFDGEISITGVRCGENEIPFVTAEGSSSRVPKVTVPGATKRGLDRWMRLREKALAGLLPAEEAEFSDLSELLRAASIDTPPTWLYLETASFPFEVADQQDYPITLSMDVAGTPREVTVLVLSRTLPSDSSWSPAELHTHTDTSDGNSTPANIATLYSSAGCRVAYVISFLARLMGKLPSQPR